VTLRDRLRTRAAGRMARIVFPEGADPRIRAAAAMLESLGIATPILLGAGHFDPARHELLPVVARHLTLRRPQVIRDVAHAQELAGDPLRFAAAMVALGAADGCVAGAVYATAEVLRAALWTIGLREGQTSVSASMYHGLGDRVLTYTDVAVVPMPSSEQMAHSAVAAARDRSTLVGDEPVVAFLSFSTLGSAGGPEVDRVRLATELFRTLAPGVAADGELQFDAALVPEVAARKAPGSPAAGRANVLVFPSLDAANIGYKLTERLAGASAAGPLLQGLAAPMSDLSRGAAPDDIVDVAAMVTLQAANRSS
jgi:phosphate acetyltransferase